MSPGFQEYDEEQKLRAISLAKYQQQQQLWPEQRKTVGVGACEAGLCIAFACITSCVCVCGATCLAMAKLDSHMIDHCFRCDWFAWY